MSKRHLTILVVAVVIIGAAVWGIRAGYFPEIGRFFAYDPVGYVPLCAWHGEPLTPLAPSCCAGFTAVPVTLGKTPTPIPTLTQTPLPAETIAISTASADISLPTPTVTPPPPSSREDRNLYCVVPGCQAVARPVQCIRAPCDPVVEIICPPGTSIPPRPSLTPTPAASIDTDRSPDYSNPDALLRPVSQHGNPDLFIAGYARAPRYSGADENFPPSVHQEDGSVVPSSDGMWWFYDQCDADGELTEAFLLADGSIGAISIGLDPATDPYRCERGALVPLTTTSPRPSTSGSPGGRISLSIRPLSGEPAGAIPIRPGVETPIQLYVTTNPGNLGLTAASLHVTTSTPLRMTRFEPFDLSEVLAQPQFGHDSGGKNELTVTVGSGTRPVAGYPILGTIYVTADTGTTGFLDMELVADTQITAAGYDGNVLGGYTPHRFTVTGGGKPGDVDGDGDVDIFDYNLVVSNFGRTGRSIPGDADADGDVDIFDYNLVVSNFGN